MKRDTSCASYNKKMEEEAELETVRRQGAVLAAALKDQFQSSVSAAMQSVVAPSISQPVPQAFPPEMPSLGVLTPPTGGGERPPTTATAKPTELTNLQAWLLEAEFTRRITFQRRDKAHIVDKLAKGTPRNMVAMDSFIKRYGGPAPSIPRPKLQRAEEIFRLCATP